MPDPIRLQIVAEVIRRFGPDTWQGPYVHNPNEEREVTSVIDGAESNEPSGFASRLTMSLAVETVTPLIESGNLTKDEATWKAAFNAERGRDPVSTAELRSYMGSVIGNRRLSEIIKVIRDNTDKTLSNLTTSFLYDAGEVVHPSESLDHVRTTAVFNVIYATRDNDPEQLVT